MEDPTSENDTDADPSDSHSRPRIRASKLQVNDEVSAVVLGLVDGSRFYFSLDSEMPFPEAVRHVLRDDAASPVWQITSSINLSDDRSVVAPTAIRMDTVAWIRPFLTKGDLHPVNEAD